MESKAKARVLLREDTEYSELEDRPVSKVKSDWSDRPVKGTSYWSEASSVTVEAQRKDLIFLYYNKRPRRIWSRRCGCLLVLCVLLALACGVLRLLSYLHERQLQEVPAEVFGKSDFYSLGCFPLLGNDSPSPTSPLRDPACMDPQKYGLIEQEKCHSGLPFYRFHFGEVIPWRWCAKLCLLKGLDISGVVDAKECRCGASEQNLQVWAPDLVVPRAALHFQQSPALAPSSPACRVVAARFMGRLPIEAWRMDTSETDLTYIRSIVSSAPVNSMERLPPEAPTPQAPTSPAGDWVKVAENSSCFPGRCATGWPWPIWTVYKGGIPFAFDATVVPSTRSSVQQAVLRLQQMACIKFTEVSLSFDETYKIVITQKDPGPCYCSPIGYPGFVLQDSVMNLASCGEHVGVILHELGHALGMSHEQARKDRDGYVQVNWMQISEDFREQYFTSPSSYIGSRDVGFVPYDYNSVMHYSANVAMRSLPQVHGQGIHDERMGQRNDFSPFDVVQLRDMYQCDGLRKGCVDQDEAVEPLFRVHDAVASCAMLKEYCQHKDYGETIRYFCAKSCGSCQSAGQEVTRLECQDNHAEACGLLEDYCPGKVSGLEEYMSAHCRKSCCLPQFCKNSSCEKEVPAQAEAESTAAMVITFDCPSYESRQHLQQRMQLRFSRLLGAGISVELLRVPSCLGGCHHGQVKVRQLCGCPEPKEASSCFSSCSEVRLKWLQLSTVELSDRGGGGIVVQRKRVEVPLDWENLVAYTTQHTWLKYVAAVCCAVGLLAAVLLAAFWAWWRWQDEDDEESDSETATVKVTQDGEETREENVDQKELAEWLRDADEEADFLCKGWLFRRRNWLVVLLCLLALLAAGLLVYVDVVNPLVSPRPSFQVELLERVPSSEAPVFKHLGCFASASSMSAELYDPSCMRGGAGCELPFYRLRLADPRACAEFCMGKGLDISGVLEGTECRCGASASNVIWQMRWRSDLQWTGHRVAENSPSCRLDVTQLVGPSQDVYEALRSNRDVQEKDILYVTSVVRGIEIPPPSPGHTAGQNEGRLPRVISFSFAADLSNETREVFLEAAELVARGTCLSFAETSEARLRVVGGRGCEASAIGWLSGVDLQLGWCNTRYHLGAVLHELGHALGLVNEEQRADRGSYVRSDAPILSAGVGPYDLSSVMQGQSGSLPVVSGTTSWFTRVGVRDPLIGQRSGLSALDVLKLQELYDCGSPSQDVKASVCQQLVAHCSAGVAYIETWMSENCQDICHQSPMRQLSFRFGFRTSGGFDLQKDEDRKMLGQGFAGGIARALAVSNASVEVLPEEARAQVACGCQAMEGRACRSCSTLEALLRRSSRETLERWLQQGGFAQLKVTFFKVDGQGVWMWLVEDQAAQISLCFVGTVCAAFAVMQAVWYCWWTQSRSVTKEDPLQLESSED